MDKKPVCVIISTSTAVGKAHSMRKIALYALALAATILGVADAALAKTKKRVHQPVEVSLSAKLERGDTTQMEPCAPFVSSDGTRVLETFRLPDSESCAWESTTLARVTDFREQVICSYTGEGRVPFADVARTDLGRETLAVLTKIWEADREGKASCKPRTDGRTFRTEMAPAENDFGCGANISLTRHYDFVLGVVYLMDGKGKKIGELPITRERAAEVVARQ